MSTIEHNNPIEDRPRFLSLRAKFSLFVSLVIILVCTTLSGVLIQQEAEIMKQSLLTTGTILATTLNKISIHHLVIQDTDYLKKMLEEALSAPEVVYAIVRDQQGKILVSKTKGILTNPSEVIRDTSHPLLPDEAHIKQFFSEQAQESLMDQPLITILDTRNSEGVVTLRPSSTVSTSRLWSIAEETIYDFSLPVYRQHRQSTTLDLLSSETLTQHTARQHPPTPILGIIQVGISTTHMQNALNQTVQKNWTIDLWHYPDRYRPNCSSHQPHYHSSAKACGSRTPNC